MERLPQVLGEDGVKGARIETEYARAMRIGRSTGRVTIGRHPSGGLPCEEPSRASSSQTTRVRLKTGMQQGLWTTWHRPKECSIRGCGAFANDRSATLLRGSYATHARQPLREACVLCGSVTLWRAQSWCGFSPRDSSSRTGACVQCLRPVGPG